MWYTHAHTKSCCLSCSSTGFSTPSLSHTTLSPHNLCPSPPTPFLVFVFAVLVYSDRRHHPTRLQRHGSVRCTSATSDTRRPACSPSRGSCSSRPLLQQLVSQQEEQLHKERLLQQYSRQLHEQQLLLNRQQEDQRKQLTALENAWQALLLMQQQLMRRPSAAAAPSSTNINSVPPASPFPSTSLF